MFYITISGFASFQKFDSYLWGAAKEGRHNLNGRVRQSDKFIFPEISLYVQFVILTTS
jgi:hypothetical protein